MTIKKHPSCIFPGMKLSSHPKGENPLPGYRASRLSWVDNMNSYAPAESRKKLKPVFMRIKALLAHGLKAMDLTRCWVGWHIQPLSLRPRLFHQYSGQVDDEMRYSNKTLEPTELGKAMKKLLGETQKEIAIEGLPPFHENNSAPLVCNL